jgi:hypothetical protein
VARRNGCRPGSSFSRLSPFSRVSWSKFAAKSPELTAPSPCAIHSERAVPLELCTLSAGRASSPRVRHLFWIGGDLHHREGSPPYRGSRSGCPACTKRRGMPDLTIAPLASVLRRQEELP